MLGVARNELDIIFICAVVVIKLDLGEADFALSETRVPKGDSLCVGFGNDVGGNGGGSFILGLKLDYPAVGSCYGVVILGVICDEFNVVFVCAVVKIKLYLDEAGFALGNARVPQGNCFGFVFGDDIGGCRRLLAVDVEFDYPAVGGRNGVVMPTKNSISYSNMPSSKSSFALVKRTSFSVNPAWSRAICFA